MKKLNRRNFIKQGGVLTTSLAFPFGLLTIFENKEMKANKKYDVIIIGGSYAGMAAAMALGRALRNVLIIDSGKPCNRQTPHSHNFLTQDGSTPKEILTIAKQQVSKYKTVQFLNGLVVNTNNTKNGFEITTANGESLYATKLIFATGIKDLIPKINGFGECWGVSVLHCPYCHGYEVRNETTGILANGENGFELSKLISNWTNDLTLFTNGICTLNNEQKSKLEVHNILIDENKIAAFEHTNGYVNEIVFENGHIKKIKAIYSRLPFEQHCTIPKQLGCSFTEEGYIKVDNLYKTTVNGVFACGDNVTKMRTVANAIAMGTTTGMMLNKELIENAF